MAPRRKRILVASYRSYVDLSSEDAVSLHDLMELLANEGWEVRVFTGPRFEGNTGRSNADLLREQQIRFDEFHTAAHGQEIRLCRFRLGSVEGGIWIPPDPQALPSPEIQSAWAKSFRELLESWQPSHVISFGDDQLLPEILSEASRVDAKRLFFLGNGDPAQCQLPKEVDAVIVQSSFQETWCRETLGRDCLPLFPLFVPESYRCCREDRQESFLTFVNSDPGKGGQVFARIAHKLRLKRPDIPILIVEEEARKPSLANAFGRLLPTSLFQMKYSRFPGSFLATTKLLVMPSVAVNSFSRTATAAVLNGIPIIGSNRGALPEVIGDGGVTLRIPERITTNPSVHPTDEEIANWAEAIELLWDDRHAREHLHNNSLARTKDWAPQNVVEKFSAN